MQLLRIMGLLVASVSFASLMFAGCTQQREFEEEAPESALNVPTEQRAPLTLQQNPFLSTHPATSERIAALKRALDSQRANGGEGLDNALYQAQIRPLIRS